MQLGGVRGRLGATIGAFSTLTDTEGGVAICSKIALRIMFMFIENVGFTVESKVRTSVRNNMGSVAILGSTDATVSVANSVIEAGHRVDTIVYVPTEFSISYSLTPVNISRSADISAWCETAGAVALPYEGIDEIYRYFLEHRSDVCLVAGWYHMVPARIRALFDRGVLGFHASLLPTLRGGAPLNWAILTGLQQTGVTLFELADGVDDGQIYAQATIPILESDYIGDLVEKSGKACFELVRDNLTSILEGTLAAFEQRGDVSYGLQRNPDDGRIDWTLEAADILRLIRAASRPYPGAYTFFQQRKLLIWRAEIVADRHQVYGAPGQLFRLPETGGIVIVTGRGLLRINDATDAEGVDMLPVLNKSSHQRCSNDDR